MFATSRTTKLLLHVANLTVIFFILLPVAGGVHRQHPVGEGAAG